MIVRSVKEIGALVRSRRRDLGWDQQRLAEEAAVSRLWVIELEKGKPRVATDLLLKTLRVLDLELDLSVKGSRERDGDKGGFDIDLGAIIDRHRRT